MLRFRNYWIYSARLWSSGGTWSELVGALAPPASHPLIWFPCLTGLRRAGQAHRTASDEAGGASPQDNI
jgi:hypothetical protein